MKLLHVIASIRAAGGGPAEAIRSLSAVHLREGHTIEVASLDGPAHPDVHSFPLPVHALGPGRTSYLYAPQYVPWLRRNRHRYDAEKAAALAKLAALVDGIVNQRENVLPMARLGKRKP